MSASAELQGTAAERADDLGAEVDDAPPVRRLVPASLVRPPATQAVRSVFELPKACLPMAKIAGDLHARGPSGSPQPSSEKRYLQATREDGRLVCRGAQYPNNRWTAEAIEREAIRRAKQRPPKPTWKAKTRSRKLRDLIGDAYDD